MASCGARTTTVPWGMVFCGRHIATNADGSCVAGLAPRHPSQLYEATLEGLVLFLVLRFATHRLEWLKRPGAVTGLFLLGYGLARTSLENVRMPDEGLRNLPYGLTMGMILSAPDDPGRPLPHLALAPGLGGDGFGVSLKARLLEEIARDGPMPVSAYMARCLHDPEFGYYATRPALGAEGDFLTAPLVSQMFGEMIAGWIHAVWERLGAPERLALIELGPGDGTLISDVVRALRAAPELSRALDLWLVETSGPLRALQAARAPCARFADTLEDVPEGVPFVVIANEFLDCLPIDQTVWRDGAWRERRVGRAGRRARVRRAGDRGWRDKRVPMTAPCSSARPRWRTSVWPSARGWREGGAAPCSSTTVTVKRSSATRCRPCGATGRRALWRHPARPTSPPTSISPRSPPPPEARARRRRRWRPRAPSSPVSGSIARAEALIRASPHKAEVVGRQLSRLIAPRGMGDLFKVAALTSPGLTPP